MNQPPQFPDPFEIMKKLWGQVGLPMAGMVPPLLDAQDVEKRIGDLKSVEAWLSMNLNVLRMTIQSLEVQKATLDAFKALQASASAPSAPSGPGPSAAPPPPPQSAAEAWWALLQQQPGAPGKTEKKRR